MLQRISLREGERERERERDRERDREREKATGTQALMEQECFIQHSVGIYTALQGSFFFLAKIKIKNPDLQIYKLSRKHKTIHIKERGL